MFLFIYTEAPAPCKLLFFFSLPTSLCLSHSILEKHIIALDMMM